MLNTKRNEIWNANDVINSNDLRKYIINVDSRFRNSHYEQTSTNFFYRFAHPYKNVIRVRIASVEIPNMWYNFSDKTFNTTMTIIAPDKDGNSRTLIIKIQNGNYTSAELLTEIQTQIDSGLKIPYGIHIGLLLNINAGKVTIVHNGLSNYPASESSLPTQNATPFFIDFSMKETSKRIVDFGLGYNLGFRSKAYEVIKQNNSGSLIQYEITAEGCIDVVGATYILLAVNDFYTVEQKTNENYIQALAKIIVREDKGAVIYDDGSTLLCNDIIFPSPVDLKQIQVVLMDPYGVPLDLCGLDFSFSLEVTEVLNTTLYEFYRNYIWLGSIPSLSPLVRGSGQPLLKGVGP